jgi:hypothetical protein
MFKHESQITHVDGTGGYVFDAVHSYDERAPKQQGPGRRWSYVPWTKAQEQSYGNARLVLKLKVDTTVDLKRKWRCDEDGRKCAEIGVTGKKKWNMGKLLDERK